MQAPDQNQPFGEGFNLDSYRNLLERLQQSKRVKTSLDKKAPLAPSQQPAV
jgi:hypothetical protein